MLCNPWSQWNMAGQFCCQWCCFGGLLQVGLKEQERGGGILVQVHESIRSHRRTDMERDAIWLVLHIEKTAILLCHIYRPPYSAKSLIRKSPVGCAWTREQKELMVMGDRNCNILVSNAATSSFTPIRRTTTFSAHLPAYQCHTTLTDSHWPLPHHSS